MVEKMFKISNNTKIYIACPPQHLTGGTELLHQLCYKLKGMNINVAMFYNYDGANLRNPVAERLKEYENEFVFEIEDSSNSILIVPEVLINILPQYREIQSCIWWLGWNHYLLYTELTKYKVLRMIHNYGKAILGLHKVLTFDAIRKNRYCNLAQCFFVICQLNKKKIYNAGYLSDYISTGFVDACRRDKSVENTKENIVLYNPKRNTKFVKQLMKKAPHLEFQAIENMSRDEVVMLMKRAKVYIDFGSHPGKDRMPREAALLGCCIITSTLGSAGFFNDVPMPIKYKVDRKRRNVKVVIRKIEECFQNYDKEIVEFRGYVDWILNEEEVFDRDIERLFVTEKKGE